MGDLVGDVDLDRNCLHTGTGEMEFVEKTKEHKFVDSVVSYFCLECFMLNSGRVRALTKLATRRMSMLGLEK